MGEGDSVRCMSGAKIRPGEEENEAAATSTRFDVLVAVFIGCWRCCSVTHREREVAQVSDGCWRRGFERKGLGVPVQAASTLFSVLVAIFSGAGCAVLRRRHDGTSCGYLDVCPGSVYQLTEEEKEGAPALPSPSPGFPALSTPFPYPLPPLHTFLHPLPSTFRGMDRTRGCADGGGGRQTSRTPR
jgi:hypothetical protein